jgi:predicted secreted protein
MYPKPSKKYVSKEYRMIRAAICLCCTTLFAFNASHAAIRQTKGEFEDKFRQLDEVLPTANIYRTAGGEPGHAYWQQKVDYEIDARLIEDGRRIEATERVTYRNNSPDTLRFLWLQLDQNRFRSDSMAELSQAFADPSRRGPELKDAEDGNAPKISLDELRRRQFMADNLPGYEIGAVRGDGGELSHTIVGTLMRIDLPRPLRPGQSSEFTVDFAFDIVEEDAVSARSGYEHFPDDAREGGNDIFLLAQWFPRLHAYTDYEGWTNKEFLGRGEFTLEFGDYSVSITVPADHIVSATGVLQNPNDVLSRTQRQRLKQAEEADRPVFIVTPEEALEKEKQAIEEIRTWRFEAENVRDFAWASSRKFIWDAQGHHQGGKVQPLVMAMSFYPREGEPLWSKYSTAARLSLPRGTVGQRPGGRHGVSHDHFQWPANRRTGRRRPNLQPGGETLPGRRRDSRNRAYLLSHDGQLR